MLNNPTIALLISTYNWPEALELVLKSILKQSKMPDEVVIADDGSTNETRRLIEQYAKLFPIPVKHIWHEDHGFRKSIILNKAVKQINAEYIIEIDGDILIHQNFISDHVKSAEKGYFVQGSRAMLNEKKTTEMLRSKDVKLSFFSAGLKNRFNALRAPFMKKIFDIGLSDPFHIKGCNLAFWKSDYIAVNGYYNSFKGWGGEDYEFGARLLHAGVRRKRLKWAALAFHIHHHIHCRTNTVRNDAIYQRTRTERLLYTTDGLAQV
jgi:glycosyltransferase involved in cell wall biosynthesis